MREDAVFLVDGHALCYRSFHAIKGLSTSKGQATNAIYGFIATFRKIVNQYHPAYMAVCFDSPERTHRQEKFAAYKIQRPTMPEDLQTQIPLLQEVLRAFGVAIVQAPGYEADDIIATLTAKFSREQKEVVIVSEDKDMYQLLGEHVRFLSARQDKLMDYDGIKEKMGFDPRHMSDFIGLAGDASDNIPGVAGVGPVTARRLINRYGSLEAIFARLDEITPAGLRAKLQEHRQEAFLSKELAMLSRQVPVCDDIAAFKTREPDRRRLSELFHQLEFQRLASEYGVEDEDGRALNALDCQAIETREQLRRRMECVWRIAFYPDPEEDAVVWGSLGTSDIYKIHWDQADFLKGIFEDRRVEKVLYSLKAWKHRLADKGVTVKGRVFDVKLAGYLLQPSPSAFSLKGLAWRFLQQSFSEEIAGMTGADCLWRLYPELRREIEARDLRRLLEDLELPLSDVLFRMEQEGVCLDLDLLCDLSKQCAQQMEILRGHIYAQAGEEFNINSPKQLSRILFDRLKLPVVKKTKTGFSTNEEVLLRLAPRHEVPALILDYRQLAKLKSTYLDALPALVDKETGRIHAEFDQTGTETGRLSSRRPNLQNIPVRTEIGRQIRKAIIPRQGNWLISADYSQVELRILAHLSGDEHLIQAFARAEDVHRYTASLMFDVDESAVTSTMRNAAKRVNFGIIYGMSAFGLAKDLGIAQEEAQDFIDRYFSRYPGVKKFIDQTIALCERQGYVSTILQRRRYIPEITSRNNGVRQFAQRQAINTPVQGSAADLIKLAMLQMDRALQKERLQSRMLITVHDELVFDVPAQERDRMIGLTRQVMEHLIELVVPLTVTIKVGRNWLEMEEV